MFVVFVSLFVLALSDISPLLKHDNEKRIDRIVDGVSQREYIVIFNHMAPGFGLKETLVNWGLNHGVKPRDVLHYYSFGKFHGFSGWLSEETLRVIRELNFVDYVEEDVVVSLDFTREPELLKAVTPVAPDAAWRARVDWGQQRINRRDWNLQTVDNDGKDTTLYTSPGSGSATYAPRYDVPTTWNWKNFSYSTPSQGEHAIVWIADTGIQKNHTEFTDARGNTRVDVEQNFVDAPDNGTDDLNGHGTHCAGTAAGNWRGVAPLAKLRNVRVLGAGGSGSWAGVIAGINYVATYLKEHGDKEDKGFTYILSMSLGGGAQLSVDEAVNNAVTAGVIVVVAAGNSNNNACGTGGIGGNSPARAELAISVAASASDDSIATFSSYGPCTKSIAPGVFVTSAWIGGAINLYNDISGTSMATPHVAGAIAVHVSTAGIPTDPDSVKADLVLDQTANRISGLTGVKSTTPNLLLNSQWKYGGQ